VRVTLIRHAEAGDDAPRDADRSLTARGREDARQLGHALGKRGVEFALMLSSPLVRAVQSAEIVAAEIAYRDRIEVTDLLVPEAAASQVLTFLKSTARRFDGAPSIALVAHEPILSAVAAALIGKPRYPPLRKAEALRIRLGDDPDEGKGLLRWRVDARGHREQL
jgi:phosphohistidine phosphatase